MNIDISCDISFTTNEHYDVIKNHFILKRISHSLFKTIIKGMNEKRVICIISLIKTSSLEKNIFFILPIFDASLDDELNDCVFRLSVHVLFP